MASKTLEKPALVLENKLAIVVGTHNGVEYSEEEVKKLFLLYKQIESKPFENRTTDEIHATDLHRGDDEDHKDSTGTWVGDVRGVYWDDVANGFGFKEWNFVEEDFAKKIRYQKKRGKASFGASPRLNVLRVGTKATEILPKNISIVLTPAGGEELMLSQSKKIEGEEGRELRQDIIQELTLSEQETLSGGKNKMDEKLEALLKGITTRLDAADKQHEKEMQKKKKEEEEKMAALELKLKETEEALAKKKKDEEEDEGKLAKKKKEEEEMQKKKKEEDEKMAKKKEEEEKMQGEGEKDKKKYKYYGALGARDSILQKFSIAPDISKLDAQSINRIAEDLSKAAKIFEGEFTLESAQKGIEEIYVVLANLPHDKKEEAALTKRVDEALSSRADVLSAALEQRINPDQTLGGRRKGLIIAGSEREDVALSQSKNAGEEQNPSRDEIEASLVDTLAQGLGLKK